MSGHYFAQCADYCISNMQLALVHVYQLAMGVLYRHNIICLNGQIK